jgi:uncharacterized protein
MSEGSVLVSKMKELYKKVCQEEWNAYTAGILVAFFSVIMMAWMRPWGAVGAIRNWGEWILYGVGWYPDAPSHLLQNSGSVIGIGFVAGAFLSACLGNNFALRVPPRLEMVKGVVAGIFMGVGAAIAGGCNVGGMYNAIGSLAANVFSMWLGLVIGVLVGLKYLYWEMENITWGSGGAKTFEFPAGLQIVLGVIALGGLIWGAYAYAGSDEAYLAQMSGVLLIAAALGYTMQRGRWCMVQAFREPHMTGDSTLARSVALSIVIVAIGILVLKYTGLRLPEHYVRGTFGWGSIVGGAIFGLGAMLAGGCGSGSLWRVGEGQIKLWIAVPIFGITNALLVDWIQENDFEGMEAWLEEGITDTGKLGSFVYMPDTFLGYGGTLALIVLVMAAWYVIVDWNEETNKLTLEM